MVKIELTPEQAHLAISALNAEQQRADELPHERGFRGARGTKQKDTRIFATRRKGKMLIPERPIALVFRLNATIKNFEDVISLGRERLSRTPKRVTFLRYDEMPIDYSGKIMKHDLRKMILDRLKEDGSNGHSFGDCLDHRL